MWGGFHWYIYIDRRRAGVRTIRGEGGGGGGGCGGGFGWFWGFFGVEFECWVALVHCFREGKCLLLTPFAFRRL